MKLFIIKHPFGREIVLKVGRTTFELDRSRFEIVKRGRVILSLKRY